MDPKPAELAAEAALPLLEEPVSILIAKSNRIYAEALSSLCRKVFEEAHTTHATGIEALAALQANTFDYGISGFASPLWMASSS